MKKLYWRPQRLSTRIIFLLALLAAIALFSVETFREQKKQPFYKEKLAAARLAKQAFNTIHEERRKRRLNIDLSVDPADSGLIGSLISPVTTNTGHLSAKQTSINPNFAAVIVHLLKRAGVESGDMVAVGQSGSFPALNIATFAATKTLGVQSLVISSAGSSQWGANMLKFTWPDMERVLVDHGLISSPSIAMSLGGIDDSATGLSEKGRHLLIEAIRRSGYTFLEIENFEDSIEKRMTLYQEHSGDKDIKVYINIGGGTISVGTRVGKELFKEGLNRYLPRGGSAVDSIMSRFAKNSVPVIHLTKISKLAQRYGLPIEPQTTPPVGEGKIFIRETYNIWIGIGSLVMIFLLMFGFLRLDLAYRLFPAKPTDASASRAEPMI